MDVCDFDCVRVCVCVRVLGAWACMCESHLCVNACSSVSKWVSTGKFIVISGFEHIYGRIVKFAAYRK